MGWAHLASLTTSPILLGKTFHFSPRHLYIPYVVVHKKKQVTFPKVAQILEWGQNRVSAALAVMVGQQWG